jgi:hypothetical protein
MFDVLTFLLKHDVKEDEFCSEEFARNEEQLKELVFIVLGHWFLLKPT